MVNINNETGNLLKYKDYKYNSSGKTCAYTDENDKKVQLDNTARTKTAEQLTFTQIIDNFIQGNMVIDEVMKGLKANKNVKDLKSTDMGNRECVEFTYNKKSYKLYCDKTLSESQVDNKEVAKISASLVNGYKLDDETLKKYFDVAEEVNGKVTYYVLKADIGYRTIGELVKALKNKVTLDNFMNDENKKSNTVRNLYTLHDDGKDISIRNSSITTFQNVDKINFTNADDFEKQKEEALNKVIKDFTSGNLNLTQICELLNVIGVKNREISHRSGITTWTFEYNNKKYSISCNSEAARNSVDDKRQDVYSYDSLKKMGLSSATLAKYFTQVSDATDTTDGTTDLSARYYILNDPNVNISELAVKTTKEEIGLDKIDYDKIGNSELKDAYNEINDMINDLCSNNVSEATQKSFRKLFLKISDNYRKAYGDKLSDAVCNLGVKFAEALNLSDDEVEHLKNKDDRYMVYDNFVLSTLIPGTVECTMDDLLEFNNQIDDEFANGIGKNRPTDSQALRKLILTLEQVLGLGYVAGSLLDNNKIEQVLRASGLIKSGCSFGIELNDESSCTALTECLNALDSTSIQEARTKIYKQQAVDEVMAILQDDNDVLMDNEDGCRRLAELCIETIQPTGSIGDAQILANFSRDMSTVVDMLIDAGFTEDDIFNETEKGDSLINSKLLYMLTMSRYLDKSKIVDNDIKELLGELITSPDNYSNASNVCKNLGDYIDKHPGSGFDEFLEFSTKLTDLKSTVPTQVDETITSMAKITSSENFKNFSNSLVDKLLDSDKLCTEDAIYEIAENAWYEAGLEDLENGSIGAYLFLNVVDSIWNTILAQSEVTKETKRTEKTVTNILHNTITGTNKSEKQTVTTSVWQEIDGAKFTGNDHSSTVTTVEGERLQNVQEGLSKVSFKNLFKDSKEEFKNLFYIEPTPSTQATPSEQTMVSTQASTSPQARSTRAVTNAPAMNGARMARSQSVIADMGNAVVDYAKDYAKDYTESISEIDSSKWVSLAKVSSIGAINPVIGTIICATGNTSFAENIHNACDILDNAYIQDTIAVGTSIISCFGLPGAAIASCIDLGRGLVRATSHLLKGDYAEAGCILGTATFDAVCDLGGPLGKTLGKGAKAAYTALSSRVGSKLLKAGLRAGAGFIKDAFKNAGDAFISYVTGQGAYNLYPSVADSVTSKVSLKKLKYAIPYAICTKMLSRLLGYATSASEASTNRTLKINAGVALVKEDDKTDSCIMISLTKKQAEEINEEYQKRLELKNKENIAIKGQPLNIEEQADLLYAVRDEYYDKNKDKIKHLDELKDTVVLVSKINYNEKNKTYSVSKESCAIVAQQTGLTEKQVEQYMNDPTVQNTLAYQKSQNNGNIDSENLKEAILKKMSQLSKNENGAYTFGADMKRYLAQELDISVNLVDALVNGSPEVQKKLESIATKKCSSTYLTSRDGVYFEDDENNKQYLGSSLLLDLKNEIKAMNQINKNDKGIYTLTEAKYTFLAEELGIDVDTIKASVANDPNIQSKLSSKQAETVYLSVRSFEDDDNRKIFLNDDISKDLFIKTFCELKDKDGKYAFTEEFYEKLSKAQGISVEDLKRYTKDADIQAALSEIYSDLRNKSNESLYSAFSEIGDAFKVKNYITKFQITMNTKIMNELHEIFPDMTSEQFDDLCSDRELYETMVNAIVDIGANSAGSNSFEKISAVKRSEIRKYFKNIGKEHLLNSYAFITKTAKQDQYMDDALKSLGLDNQLNSDLSGEDLARLYDKANQIARANIDIDEYLESSGRSRSDLSNSELEFYKMMFGYPETIDESNSDRNLNRDNYSRADIDNAWVLVDQY